MHYRVWRLMVFCALMGLVSANVMAQSNGVLREVFSDLGGSAVSDLTNNPSFPNSPSLETIQPDFEAPSEFADNYGTRMRALFVPPVTTNYTFWISSDDNGLLYVSLDDKPASKRLVARVNSWTASREWTKEANQQSSPLRLTNGLRYYMEALQKEGGGGDNLAVGWKAPGSTAIEVIPGPYLIPFGLSAPIISQQPANVTVIEGGTATFSVKLERMLGAVFQWRRNGTNVPDAITPALIIGPLKLSDSGSTFQCFMTNSLGFTNSQVAKLTVLPDTTRPTLASVGNLGDPELITVIFSEAVEPASATNPANYRLDQGAGVLNCVMSGDPQTVIITTTPLATGQAYTLMASNVRDLATSPNTILPNSSKTFALDFTPLDVSRITGVAEPLGPSSRRSGLTISEIMYHPADRPDGRNLEFIEIHNSQAWFEDISGYRITGDIDFAFPTNTVIPAKGFVVLAASPEDLIAIYGITPLGRYTNNLPNDQGAIRLRNNQGAILCEVDYQDQPPWPVSADGAGHSLVLARPSLGQKDPRAWAASDRIGGSPGIDNVPGANPHRTILINEFLAHTDDPQWDFIELYNYSAASVDVSSCILTDDPATNKFLVPSGTTIPALGFLAFDQSQLGFGLKAAGDTIYLKNPAGDKILDVVRFRGQANGVSTGRYPDGAPDFSELTAPTPGENNRRPLLRDVVLNEIMYEPVSGQSNDEYVELYNRGTNTARLAGWTLDNANKFTFPTEAVIPPGGYAVVAKDAARLMSNYPHLNPANTFGDYSGSLGNQGDRITLTMPDLVVTTNELGRLLTNTIHIVADQVTYRSGGRWGRWSAGGGSSLELVDPRADHRLAPNWADSDESAKSAWITVENTGVLDNGSGTANRLELFLLGPGEALVDDVQVIPQGGANVVTNGDFSNGFAGWTAQGNQVYSTYSPTGGVNGTPCMRLKATGRGDTGANRVRVALTKTLGQGSVATLRAKVRWLAGQPEILLRLHGNWLDATTNFLTARNLGTPGLPNSRRQANAGPAITDVTHAPVLPPANTPVRVSARVSDPDGLATLILRYRVDPSTNWLAVSMVSHGAGYYSAAIPGQPANATVAFYIESTDNASTRMTRRFPVDAPARQGVMVFGAQNGAGNFGTYHVWLTRETIDRWANREKLSNDSLDGTFVYGSSRVIYNIGAQYSGSPYHSPGYNSPVGNYCDYVLVFPGDDPLLGETDANLLLPGNGCCEGTMQREQTAFGFARQFGLPFNYRRHVHVFFNNGRRAPMMMEDSQQANGDFAAQWWPSDEDGDLHKIQIWFEFDDSAASFSGVGASFGNFTTTGGVKKLARYRWNWARRAAQHSISHYTNLFALHDTMLSAATGANFARAVEAMVDVDEWARVVACEHLYGNSDSFCFGGGQNLYVYKPPGDRWRMILWDLDFAFVAEVANANLFSFGGDRLNYLLSQPPFRRMYYRALQDAANTFLTPAQSDPLLNARYSAFTTARFTPESPQSIKNFIALKRSTIFQALSNAFAPFNVTTPSYATGRNLVTISGTAPVEVADIRINGKTYPANWTSLTNWSLQIALAEGVNNLVVEGQNNRGARLPGYQSTLALTNNAMPESPVGIIVINEIMYNPILPGASYLELYNRSLSNAFDLTSWRLEGLDLTFARGTVLTPGGYLIVAQNRTAFASAYGAAIPVAAEFAGELDNAGETLSLIKPGSSPEEDLIVDTVRYDNQPPWPAAADGFGSSLQVVDASQDNWRPGNWLAAPPGSDVKPRVLLSLTNSWRFTSNNVSAANWNASAYNDSTWSNGLPLFYVETAALPWAKTTPLPAVMPTWYFRTHFNYQGPTTSVDLKLTTVLDDGAVFYLNGELLYPLRVEEDPVTYTSLSSSGIGDAGVEGPFVISNPAIIQGDNTVAVEVKQSGAGSSDIVFGMTLESAYNTMSLYSPGAANSGKASLKPFPNLWINELQPYNATGPTDRFGEHDPWVEIYNADSNTVSLAGIALSDNYTNLARWSFPSNVTIAPHGFIIVWLDGESVESDPGELHASFRLAPDKGQLALVSLADGGRVLDYINYDRPGADRSVGLMPDGDPKNRRILHYPTPGAPNNGASLPVSVFINEWMADNIGTLADPADGDFEDWFELYNASSNRVDLAGYFLSDSLTNKTQFEIPPGYSIPPLGFLLVWADAESGQNQSNRADLHVRFKLATSGDAIALFAPDGSTVDAVVFGPQTNDISQGRFPDGGVNLLFMTTPTPRLPNLADTVNTPPHLDAIPPRMVFRGQNLQFPISAQDADQPPQSLTFTLESGAPLGAGINPSSGQFVWSPTLAVPDGAYSLTVRVTDSGTPPLAATSSFNVIVSPEPQFAQPRMDSMSLLLTWPALPNVRYRLEYKDDLNAGTWLPLGEPIMATGSNVTVTNNLQGATTRFFRLGIEE